MGRVGVNRGRQRLAQQRGFTKGAIAVTSGPLGRGSSEFTRFAARRGGCYEIDLEFGQIDDIRWSARAIWAVGDG